MRALPVDEVTPPDVARLFDQDDVHRADIAVQLPALPQGVPHRYMLVSRQIPTYFRRRRTSEHVIRGVQQLLRPAEPLDAVADRPEHDAVLSVCGDPARRRCSSRLCCRTGPSAYGVRLCRTAISTQTLNSHAMRSPTAPRAETPLRFFGRASYGWSTSLCHTSSGI